MNPNIVNVILSRFTPAVLAGNVLTQIVERDDVDDASSEVFTVEGLGALWVGHAHPLIANATCVGTVIVT